MKPVSVPLKAIIFDFDGTILDTETTEFKHWQALYRRYDRELNLVDWQQGIGTWDVFDPWLGLPEEAQNQREEIKIEMRQAILNEIEQQGLREGVREMLEAIKDSDLRLGLASSSDRDWIMKWINHYKLDGFFEVMATRYDVEKVKPSPDLYLLAAKQLGVSPHECLAIEDSLNGATAAVNAGMKVLIVPHEITATQPFPKEWVQRKDFLGDLQDFLQAIL